MFGSLLARFAAVATLTLLVVGLSLRGAGATDLTVTYTTADGSRAEVMFSSDDLRAMEQVRIVTENDFVDGPVAFSGPLARDVIARSGATLAGIVSLTAANDYVVEVPAKDFTAYEVILALEADGVALSRRDKGPIWLMYPISTTPDLQVPSTNNKLIWQLVRMDLQ